MAENIVQNMAEKTNSLDRSLTLPAVKNYLRLSHFLTLIIFFSMLEKDFEELMQRYFYDYIELQLDFAMDLYPFFPPLVKVILIFSKNEKKFCYI